MGKIMPYEGVWPELHESVFMTDGAYVIGDVKIGAHSEHLVQRCCAGGCMPHTDRREDKRAGQCDAACDA